MFSFSLFLMDTLSLIHHSKCDEPSPLFWMEESLKMFGLIFTHRYVCMYVYMEMLLHFCLLKEKNHLLTSFSPFSFVCLEEVRAIIKIYIWKTTVIPKTGFGGLNLIFFLPDHTN